MSFLSSIFRGQKPTTATAAPAMAELEAELAAIPARLAKARETLRQVADLTDEQHEDAEIELASAQRSEARLKAQIEQLRAVHEQAAKEEAAVALDARANAAQQRVEREGPKLLAEYEKLADKLAKTAAALAEIDDEVGAVNRVIREKSRRAPEAEQRSPILGVSERFLIEPDTVDPDHTVSEEQWGFVDDTGKWRTAAVLVNRDGDMVPETSGYIRRTVVRTSPGRTRKGRSIPSPIYNLSLPAARIGSGAFWPRLR